MQKKYRKGQRRKFRSVRKLNAFLLAFGLTGLALGCLLMGFFGLHGQWRWAGVGGIYVLVAGALLGVRGILQYLHEERKARHARLRQ